MINEEKARSIAHHWIKSWNDRDLDQIMSHYTDDIVLVSPLAAKILNQPDGTVRGKKALRNYFQQGLEIYPDLRFTLKDVMWSLSSLVLYYENQKGTKAGEYLEIGTAGKITKAIAHHNT